MKSLVLAEKPSVGKDIARVLKCTRGAKGYLEGDNYVVTWALGHLVTLADPESYNKSFKTWNLDDLPIIPEKLSLVVIKETRAQYNVVKDLLHRNDINSIIIATDAGREGELVARWILEKAGVKKPIKRLWISSVTDSAIKDGFSKLKDGNQYINLGNSAKARAEADWLVGINATRALTTKHNSQLSCGRVQTPTVSIIAKREDEIRHFVPRKFYGISASVLSDTNVFNLTWQDSKTFETRSFDEAKMKTIIDSLKQLKEAQIKDITKTAKKTFSPRLYDLTELQRDCNIRFNYSPKDTLSIMQKLYETHKVLTYPRTDSRYISTDVVPTLVSRLKACCVPPYNKICMGLMAKPIKANPNFVDNAKVSDHHAIIPTDQPVDFRALNDKERKVYDLVVMRFLSVLYPPFEFEQTKVIVRIGTESFVASGKIVTAKGFKEINTLLNKNDNDDEENEQGLREQTLPPLKNFEKLAIKSFSLTDGKTKPPAPFTEATLLSAMENPGKYMNTQDNALAKTLSETGGLGTVATRADIIEKLYATFYIEKKGKDIFATSKGRQLLKLAPLELRSPELTGSWEQKLLKISQGTLNKEAFLTEIRTYTRKIIGEIKQSSEVYRHDNLSRTRCPKCSKFMLEVNGKRGKMLVCQDRECGERVQVQSSSGNYRPKQDNGGLSKKEVENYLNDINKEVGSVKNNAIADALKGLKF